MLWQTLKTSEISTYSSLGLDQDICILVIISAIQVRRDQGLVVKIRCPMRFWKPVDKVFLILCISWQRGASEGQCWLVLTGMSMSIVYFRGVINAHFTWFLGDFWWELRPNGNWMLRPASVWICKKNGLWVLLISFHKSNKDWPLQPFFWNLFSWHCRQKRIKLIK